MAAAPKLDLQKLVKALPDGPVKRRAKRKLDAGDDETVLEILTAAAFVMAAAAG